MKGMFRDCSSLTSIDFSNFNSSKVTNMAYMFSGCSIMNNFELNKLDTSKVTDMSYLFYKCDSLKSFDLSIIDTSSVTMLSDFASSETLVSKDSTCCRSSSSSAVFVLPHAVRLIVKTQIMTNAAIVFFMIHSSYKPYC